MKIRFSSPFKMAFRSAGLEEQNGLEEKVYLELKVKLKMKLNQKYSP